MAQSDFEKKQTPEATASLNPGVLPFVLEEVKELAGCRGDLPSFTVSPCLYLHQFHAHKVHKCHMRCPSMRTAGPAFIGFPGRPQDVLTRSDACMTRLHVSTLLDVSSSTSICISVIHYPFLMVYFDHPCVITFFCDPLCSYVFFHIIYVSISSWSNSVQS